MMRIRNNIGLLLGAFLGLLLASCSSTVPLTKKDTQTRTVASGQDRGALNGTRPALCKIPVEAELCSFAPTRLSAPHSAGTAEPACNVDNIVSGKRHARVPDLLFPVPSGVLSSPFGYRGRVFHSGLDIAAPKGEPILACADGRVVLTGSRRGYRSYGQTIMIDHGRDVLTHYAHLSKILVRKGEKVRKGQTIGLVGTSGRATSPHLHLEVRVGRQIYNPYVHFAPSQLEGIEVAKGFNLTPMGPVRARSLTARH